MTTAQNFFRNMLYTKTMECGGDVARCGRALMELKSSDLSGDAYRDSQQDMIYYIEHPEIEEERYFYGTDAQKIYFERVKDYYLEHVKTQQEEYQRENGIEFPSFESVFVNNRNFNIAPKTLDVFLGGCMERAEDSYVKSIFSKTRQMVVESYNDMLSYDMSGFPTFSVNEAASSAEEIEDRELKESFQIINDKMNSCLTESALRDYNMVLFYVPLVENFEESVDTILGSDICKNNKNQVAAQLAVATYEAVMHDLIHPVSASAILHVLEEATMNEFSVADMLPEMGSTEGWGTKLAKTPIEVVVKKTNGLVDNNAERKQFADNYYESVFQFLEYVTDLYLDQLTESDLTPLYESVFFEQFLPKYVGDGKTIDQLKKELKKKEDELSRAINFRKEYQETYRKNINDAYAYKDAFAEMPLKGKAKELYQMAYAKIKKQDTGKTLNDEKIRKKALEEVKKSYNTLIDKHGMGDYKGIGKPYSLDFRKTGPNYGRSDYDISKMISDDIENLKYSIKLKREKGEPELVDKDTPRKIVDISTYKKKGTKTGTPKRVAGHKDEHAMESVSYETALCMGMQLLRQGVEPTSLAMEIFEEYCGYPCERFERAFVEAGAEPKTNGIFEVESKKVYDKVFRLTGVKPAEKELNFQRRMSPDKSHIAMYIEDKSKAGETQVTTSLSSCGYKKVTDPKVKGLKFQKQVQSYTLEAIYEPEAGRLMLSYNKDQAVKEAAPIDDDIKDVIEALNKKGYITKYSCSGHPESYIHGDRNKDNVKNGKLYTTARVTFEGLHHFKNIPDHWRLSEKDGKTTIFAKAYSYGKHQGDGDTAFEKWKEMYMMELRDWVSKLPDIGTDKKVPDESEDDKKETETKESVSFQSMFDDMYYRNGYGMK